MNLYVNQVFIPTYYLERGDMNSGGVLLYLPKPIAKIIYPGMNSLEKYMVHWGGGGENEWKPVPRDNMSHFLSYTSSEPLSHCRSYRGMVFKDGRSFRGHSIHICIQWDLKYPRKKDIRLLLTYLHPGKDSTLPARAISSNDEFVKVLFLWLWKVVLLLFQICWPWGLS